MYRIVCISQSTFYISVPSDDLGLFTLINGASWSLGACVATEAGMPRLHRQYSTGSSTPRYASRFTFISLFIDECVMLNSFGPQILGRGRFLVRIIESFYQDVGQATL
jgi:hypothetical protein